MQEEKLDSVNWRNFGFLLIGFHIALFLTDALFMKLEHTYVSFDPSLELIISVFLIQDIFWLVIVAKKVIIKWTTDAVFVSIALILYMLVASAFTFFYVTLGFILS